MIELLVVIGIIGILAALIFPMLQKAQRAAQYHRAEVEVNALYAALKAYMTEYSKWPLTNAEEQANKARVTPSILRILTGVPNDSELKYNPRRRIFLSLNAVSTNSDGLLVDPWGTPYEFGCDSDMSGSMGSGSMGSLGSYYSGLPGHICAAWSLGPNCKGDAPKSTDFDDILSW